jgi:TetR/AcrR family transcriptional repressor of nem operon
MRYHPDDKQKTRNRIIKVAARRYRAEGLSAVGIGNLMADLGMTHGGFYAHFTDKEALVAEACCEAFSGMMRHWEKLVLQAPKQDGLRALTRDYLSLQHRNHPDTGCFAAALGGEMARRDNRSRQAFSAGINQMLLLLSQQSEETTDKMKPEAMLGLMVGSLILSRAVSDPELSERLLSTAKQAVLASQSD